jgi:hypothetical protein
MAGLFAFFYGTLHFLIYAIADRLLSLIDFPEGVFSRDTASRLAAAIGEDIYKRPFITVGFTALVLMVPLALTSTAGMIRRLGGKRLQALHPVRLRTGVVHYWWLGSRHQPARNYAVVVGVLPLFRVVGAAACAEVRARAQCRAEANGERSSSVTVEVSSQRAATKTRNHETRPGACSGHPQPPHWSPPSSCYRGVGCQAGVPSPLAVGELPHVAAVVAHHEQLAVGLRRVRVDHCP